MKARRTILCAPDSPLEALMGHLEAVAPLESTVLLQGESGTGKELLARHLHGASRRAKGPFVAVNCAAIAPTLLESELFGHEKGAFTGAHERRIGRLEQASGGTLFLDEIGELGLPGQAALLRSLQERTLRRVGGFDEVVVDFRLVAATHRDLWGMVSAGSFRRDLFFRLHVVPLHVAPLRERRQDLPVLANELLRRIALRLGCTPPLFPSGALAALAGHDWPGNVRELENLLERWVALAPLGVELEALLEEHRARLSYSGPATGDCGARREGFERLLARHGGNRARAAAEVGITRRALTYHLTALGLTRRRETGPRKVGETAALPGWHPPSAVARGG